MYRKTYVEINEDILKENVKEIIKKYNNYKYYIGVVKNNAYNHGIKVVNSLIHGGINYLAVSSLEEAISIRKYNNEIPILCLGIIDVEYIHDCINNNVTITVESYDYLEKLVNIKLDYELKIHLKLNTGMNRLGINNEEELKKCFELSKKIKNINIEGIYTHIATSGIVDYYYDRQIKKLEQLIKNIDLKSIKIIHLGRSQTLVNHDKLKYVNGVRLGIIMYGFSQSIRPDNSLKGKLRNLKNNFVVKKYKISKTNLTNDLNITTAFSLYSKVVSIKKIQKGEFVGYGANYIAKTDMLIGILPVGYADGVDKSFGQVFINDQKYQILADSMDMLMIEVDEKIQLNDKVEIIGKNITIKEICLKLHCNSYRLFNRITTRVPRVHFSGKEKVEIKY